MRPYLITYRPGPKWIPGSSIYDQPLEGHGAHLQAAFVEGRTICGGPFTDSTGGFAMILGSDEQEIRDWIARDPSVVEGIFVAEAHPVHMVFNRYLGKGLTDRGPGF